MRADTKSSSIMQKNADPMNIEEIARKYSMSELKPVAKKYAIVTRCVKRIDIIRALLPEALAELTGEHQ